MHQMGTGGGPFTHLVESWRFQEITKSLLNRPGRTASREASAAHVLQHRPRSLANPHHASPAGRGHGPFLRMTSPTNPRCRLACFAPHPGKPSGEIAPLPQLLASTWMLGPGSLPTGGQWWCWLIRMLAWEALTRFDSKLLRRTSRGADNRHLASSRDWQRCCCFHHVYLRGILLFFNVSALEYIQQPRHLCY